MAVVFDLDVSTATLRQTVGGSAATADGDLVGEAVPSVGNNAQQSTSTKRPTLRIIGGRKYLVGDGGDVLSATLAAATGVTSTTIFVVVRRLSTDPTLSGAAVKVGSNANGYGIGVGGTEFDNTGSNMIGVAEAVAWVPSTVTIPADEDCVLIIRPYATNRTSLFLVTATTAIGVDFGAGSTFVAPSAEVHICGYDPTRYTRLPVAYVQVWDEQRGNATIEADARAILAYTPPSGVSGTGTATLPALSASGAGTVLVSGTGESILPALTASGVAQSFVLGSGSATLPALTASGEAVALVSGVGSATLPALTSSGTAQALVLGQGVATLPALTASGVAFVGGGDPPVTGVGLALLPALIASGVARALVSGTGAATLPALTASGSATVSEPPPPSAYIPGPHRACVTLPRYRVASNVPAASVRVSIPRTRVQLAPPRYVVRVSIDPQENCPC